MDPAGILMLRSVRKVFEIIGIKPESIKFIKENFDKSNIVKALTEEPKKCPTIVVTELTGDPCNPIGCAHAMVATNALKGIEITGKTALRNEWFINCKNSYREEISAPGTVCNSNNSYCELSICKDKGRIKSSFYHIRQ